MRTPLHKLAAAGTAVGLTLGLAAAPVDAGPPSGETIVDFAVSASGGGAFDDDHTDFDILVQGVLATELDGALSAKGQRTVFAPTDQAFLDLTGTTTEAEAFDAVVALLGVDGTRDVISYHVAPGARTSDEVVPAERIRTITKDFITKDAGSTVLVDGRGNLVDIVGVDNVVDNGVVHVINAVLLPAVD